MNVALIGIADDQGVLNVGGRLGAARGPAAFRKIFSRFKSELPVLAKIKDCGDLKPRGAGGIETTHRQAADLVRECHPSDGISVIVGGGHDHGFTHLLGLSEMLQARGKKTRLGCINIDAHLDVRVSEPVITSGSPFYMAIERGVLDPRRFIEFGIQSHCNGPDLWKYAHGKKLTVIPYSELRNGKAVAKFRTAIKKLSRLCDFVAVSLDLDAAAAAFAPGVSAPQAEGFSSSEIIEMMEIAGQESKVRSLGIFELCPEHDIGDMTARLAATAAFHFVQAKLQR